MVAPGVAHAIDTCSVSLYGPSVLGVKTGGATTGCTTKNLEVATRLLPMFGGSMALALIW